jgi:hypothetical protein
MLTYSDVVYNLRELQWMLWATPQHSPNTNVETGVCVCGCREVALYNVALGKWCHRYTKIHHPEDKDFNAAGHRHRIFVAGNRFLYRLSGLIEYRKFNISSCNIEVAKSHMCCCLESLRVAKRLPCNSLTSDLALQVHIRWHQLEISLPILRYVYNRVQCLFYHSLLSTLL